MSRRAKLPSPVKPINFTRKSGKGSMADGEGVGGVIPQVGKNVEVGKDGGQVEKKKVAAKKSHKLTIPKLKFWLRVVVLAILVLVVVLVKLTFGQIQDAVVFDPTTNEVQVLWLKNVEPDVSYYTVYAHRGDSVVVLGHVVHPDTTFRKVLDLSRYYELIGFSVQAVDMAGNKSPQSEVIKALFCRDVGRVFADVNNDGMVDIEDLELIRVSRGARPWFVMWAEAKDLNGDAIIDVFDFEIARTRKGRRL